MPIAVKPRIAAGISLVGLLLVIGLASASTASAAAINCKGHTSLGTVTDDFENPIDYRFACDSRILGYMVMSDQEFDAFTVEVTTHDPTSDAIIGTDNFTCEGDIPGNGVGCTSSSYTPNGVVKGSYSVTDRKPCVEPRSNAQLIVVAEQLDVVTGLPKKVSLGNTAGPFDLGRPRGCPKSSILGGLLAEIALVRADLRAA